MRSLGGHTLLEWSIRACLNASLINRTIVTTDSLDYAAHSVGCGAEVPFMRPLEMSSDTAPDSEFLFHALNWLGKTDRLPDYLIHVRPTTPFRNPQVIDDAIRTFALSKSATSLRSVHLMSESAYKTFQINDQGYLAPICSENKNLDDYNMARQSFPPTYLPNGYVDVLSSSYMNSTGLIHGNCVLPFVTSPAWEVDEERDFRILEYELLQDPAIKSVIF
jgi:N-acylneuraminate cytidylyltransferase